VVVVDAANVVGSRPDGWWRDRAGAAGRLVGSVRAAVADRRLDGQVVVVLEGRARPGAAEGVADGVSVVHAAGEGDDRIVEEARAAVGAGGAPVLVVTADRGLAARVEAEGADVVGPRWLLARLDP
jgi:uncharacterized protein YaiI (UPF0178 family)